MVSVLRFYTPPDSVFVLAVMPRLVCSCCAPISFRFSRLLLHVPFMRSLLLRQAVPSRRSQVMQIATSSICFLGLLLPVYVAALCFWNGCNGMVDGLLASLVVGWCIRFEGEPQLRKIAGYLAKEHLSSDSERSPSSSERFLIDPALLLQFLSFVLESMVKRPGVGGESFRHICMRRYPQIFTNFGADLKNRVF